MFPASRGHRARGRAGVAAGRASGISSWMPDGPMGDFFRRLGSHTPPPSALAQPPPLWGSEAHVEELVDATRIELEFERELPWLRRRPRRRLEFIHDIQVRAADDGAQLAEVSGRWRELWTALIDHAERAEPADPDAEVEDLIAASTGVEAWL
jgi:hypothetical protein